jgi:hypothetical protein
MRSFPFPALVVSGLCLLAPAQALARPTDFLGEAASSDVRQVADWTIGSDDHAGLPFVIVDKVQARVFVFNGHGALLGAAPALVGLARGDDSVPGIGDRPLAAIAPSERTTPAGRFVASLGQDLNKEVLWVDYADAISLHPVINSNPREHRLRRLASVEPLEHRISYGCINVPAAFYARVVSPAFAGTHGIVYVLPETRSIAATFAMDRSTKQIDGGGEVRARH